MANVEYECRKCGKRVPAEQYRINRFCSTSDCGTFLSERPQPRHWLFQFNSSIYKWIERMSETQEPEQWLITQHARLIRKSDLVVIWASGKKVGVYALGQIVTRPAKNALNPNQRKYFLNKDDIDKFQQHYSSYVEYLNVFLKKPLLLEQCNQDKILMDMQVFANPQGSNFRLTAEQWNRILELQTKPLEAQSSS